MEKNQDRKRRGGAAHFNTAVPAPQNPLGLRTGHPRPLQHLTTKLK